MIPEKMQRDVEKHREKLQRLEANKEREEAELKTVMDGLKTETQVSACKLSAAHLLTSLNHALIRKLQ